MRKKSGKFFHTAFDKRKFAIMSVAQTKTTNTPLQTPKRQRITLWPVGRLRALALTYTPHMY
jgi:hypothetical protein